MRTVAWFDEIHPDELANTAGGKGASLCRLHRHGMPVPSGFIVCSELFNHFMASSGLSDKVAGMIADIDFNDHRRLSETARSIRDMICAENLPADLAAGIAERHAAMGDDVPVAVRSSGTAEDLEGASFAGQQETFLYVRGGEVPRYVKECWASLYNDRAIFYRREKGFSERDISIAVVVQRMVNADKSGVMFSANPINGDLGAVMIEAAFGLGEGVVQGVVTPDNYVVRKDTYAVEQEHISEKECMVVRDDGGGVKEVEVPEDIRSTPVLTEAERNALVDLSVRAERFYGKPQDLEWAIENGELFLLQSRPITTL